MSSQKPSAESFAALFEASPKQGFRRRFAVGDVLDLEVVRIGQTEVFVALDGKSEGMIPVGELTGPDGRPTVSVGSRVAARVASIDRQSGSVELRALSKEPVVANLGVPGAAEAAAPSSVVVGLRVKGKVTGVERFGVFLEFPVEGKSRPERGLVPTAELGMPRGADLRKSFPVGSELEAAVLSVDERGRIRLSVVALASAEERRAFESYSGAAAEQKGGEKASGFGTLGDLLKKKK